MRFTHLTRLSLTALLALAAVLLGPAGPATAAGPAAGPAAADLSFTVDQQTVTPGSTVALTMTFTNNQETDIWFVYQSVQPTWLTTQRKDLAYAFTSCTGDGVTCTGTGTTSLGVSYAVPLPPGATRTVTLTLRIAENSGCNGNIGFYSYLYYEYNGGQATKDGMFTTPETRVACAPAAASARS
ncbi:hypothetical protein E2C00_03555 [Streptomyces sp. WAC05374]|uniref:hypothetical protein n=1 Tax=Streptomyces sp. WAC05374 TaxID=2487420 RepID=UPI000F88BC3E|nr:hypothetical protein [Streptomyces sp. WAC05374]RST18992.1 hypothetical protein EF905_02985 [Streptomyces sp. WAC05374]TDF50566.1 hypothetical protein E2B92_03540 [Streptomyces sp. WAC05374]TDF56855.1 hypothetical protein E2C02_10350 [Streptomyces sp. WAC05374]TDF60818.1 hypothetical protein E2C00_03555 [Streptomyces sp. WAC05374]